jgi:hypothetical protein
MKRDRLGVLIILNSFGLIGFQHTKVSSDLHIPSVCIAMGFRTQTGWEIE